MCKGHISQGLGSTTEILKTLLSLHMEAVRMHPAFIDGRTHAVTHQDRWKEDMLRADFAAVKWTDGDSPEVQTIQVITGFASDASK